MKYNINLFKNKGMCIGIAIAAAVLMFFSMFDYEERFLGEDNIYKSKKIKITYDAQAKSEILNQFMWWENDLLGRVTLNKSIDLSEKTSEVYIKTGWNEMKAFALSDGETKEVVSYGPTLLGAYVDGGMKDIDGDGKNDQVYYYAQMVTNGRGFDGDGDDGEDGDGPFYKGYEQNNGYMNFQSRNLLFEDTEKMSLGIIRGEKGIFQAIFKGEPLVNANITVTSETGLDEYVKTDVSGYFYVKDLTAASSGMNIIYVDDASDEAGDIYHILNYKTSSLNKGGLASIGTLGFITVLVILIGWLTRKFLAEKRKKLDDAFLFEMDHVDIKKGDE